jgi:uncharacterized protein (TIGR00661 family)
MRILYGVTGEGLGHAMRARTVATHLESRGHEVLFAASGQAHDLLARQFANVLRIEGFRLRYRRGKLRRGASFVDNVARAPGSLRHNMGRALHEASRFDPHVALTDFDSFAHAVGRLRGVPTISLDHHHVIDRFCHPADVRARLPFDFAATRAVVRAKTPGCDHYIVSSFYAPTADPMRASRTTLVGPILRPEVMATRPTEGDTFVVYQTSSADPRLLAELARVPARFNVYCRGARRSRAAKNVEIHPFDEHEFLGNLGACRGVLAHGGHTALSEALVLGKPVLSVPLRHQGEQELTAAYLEHLGLGRTSRVCDARAITAFVRSSGHDRERIRVRAGNDDACAALDALLAEVA